MFNYCNSLVGGDGTVYDQNYTDKTKAYAGEGGYLTLKDNGTTPGDDPDLSEGWYSLIDKKLERDYYSLGQTKHEWMMFQSNGYLVKHPDGYNGFNIVTDAHIDPNDPSVLLFDFAPGTYMKMVVGYGGSIKILDNDHLDEAVPAGTYTIADGTDCYDHIGDNTFRAKTDEGVTVRYQITDEEAKTCRPFHILEIGEHGVGVYSSQATSTSTTGTLTILDIVNGYTVTEIGPRAFEHCKLLTAITLPETLKTIADYSFTDCAGITTIRIPESVNSIGYSAFSGCTGLTSYTWPSSASVATGSGVFSNCTSLTSVTLPVGLGAGSTGMFGGCIGLTDITFPEAVHAIPAYTFSGCTGLTSLTIPNHIHDIGRLSFKECSGLTSVQLPEGITEIPYGTFDRCTGLTEIVIPDGVTLIDSIAFRWCDALKTVSVPKTVTAIRYYAFNGCSSLKDFYCHAEQIPETNPTTFSKYLLANATLHVPASTKEVYAAVEPWNQFGKIVVIGEEEADVVTVDEVMYVIGDDGTAALTGLQSGISGEVVIPEVITVDGNTYPVTEISAGAFRDCQQMTSVVIPAGVTVIGEGAFAGCSGLMVIICNNPVPADLGQANARMLGGTKTGMSGVPSQFEGVDVSACVLYVPEGSVDLYRNTPGWSCFLKVEAFSPDGIATTMYKADTPTPWHMLNGSRMASKPTHKGIYIHHGRKYVVK